MAEQTRLITDDELLHIPDDGFHRHELVKGHLLVMTPAGSLHGAIVVRLTIAVGSYVEQHRLGLVFSADTGFTLERNPDTVRAPDVAFIAREVIPADGIPKAFWRGAPTLAIEVRSPDDRRAEIDHKISDYLRCGTKEVWFVEPEARTVTVYRSDDRPRTLSESDTLDGGDLLPGFSYPLSRLFSFDL